MATNTDGLKQHWAKYHWKLSWCPVSSARIREERRKEECKESRREERKRRKKEESMCMYLSVYAPVFCTSDLCACVLVCKYEQICVHVRNVHVSTCAPIHMCSCVSCAYPMRTPLLSVPLHVYTIIHVPSVCKVTCTM